MVREGRTHFRQYEWPAASVRALWLRRLDEPQSDCRVQQTADVIDLHFHHRVVAVGSRGIKRDPLLGRHFPA